MKRMKAQQAASRKSGTKPATGVFRGVKVTTQDDRRRDTYTPASTNNGSAVGRQTKRS